MNDDLFQTGAVGQCCTCQHPCTTMSLTFEAYVHPGTCEEALNNAYWKALNE